jgi:hypothetical protein
METYPTSISASLPINLTRFSSVSTNDCQDNTFKYQSFIFLFDFNGLFSSVYGLVISYIPHHVYFSLGATCNLWVVSGRFSRIWWGIDTKGETGAQSPSNLKYWNFLSIRDMIMEGDLSGSMKTAAPKPRTLVV